MNLPIITLLFANHSIGLDAIFSPSLSESAIAMMRRRSQHRRVARSFYVTLCIADIQVGHEHKRNIHSRRCFRLCFRSREHPMNTLSLHRNSLKKKKKKKKLAHARQGVN